MADLFKKIKIKIEKVADTTTKKANKVIDKSKLHLNLKMEESNLNECFEELGKAFFRQVKSGVSNDDKIAELIDKADKIEAKIDALKDELAKDIEVKKCEKCGKVLKKEKYCPECGTKVENPVSQEDEKPEVQENEKPEVNEDEKPSDTDISE